MGAGGSLPPSRRDCFALHADPEHGPGYFRALFMSYLPLSFRKHYGEFRQASHDFLDAWDCVHLLCHSLDLILLLTWSPSVKYLKCA
jgi:hypothetical protein